MRRAPSPADCGLTAADVAVMLVALVVASAVRDLLARLRGLLRRA